MGVFAGWQTTLKIGGTPTAMVAEATSVLADDSAGRHRRQITNATKRLLDPGSAVTVKDGGVAVASADVYAIDYLFGIVTFASGYVIGGAITFDASYVPLLTIAEGRAYKLNREAGQVDTTTFDSAAGTGGRRSTPTLLGASGDMELVEGTDPDLDPGADSVVLQTLMDQGTAKLIEIQYQTGWYFRAWVLFPGIEKGAEVEDVMKQTVRWQASAQSPTSYSSNAYFGIGQ